MSGALHIALVGAGQLGSRHLQALARLGRKAVVTVVDPSEAALAVARERFGQVVQDEVRAEFATDFAALPRALDAAVVATAAGVRRAAIERLLDRSELRVALLEKVLFQRIEDYDAVGRLLEARGVRAWVNCAQRLWPFFEDLRRRTLGAAHLQLGVTGSQWGLACNAIHNLDLLAFLTGEAGMRLEAAFDAGSVPSKRAGFVELTGTLVAHGARGNRVVQTSWREGDAPFAFAVETHDFRAHWDVARGVAQVAEAAGGWAWRTVETRAPYQSELTQHVIAAMLDEGRCALPGYAESAALHVQMLEVFLAHLNGRAASPADVCPIT